MKHKPIRKWLIGLLFGIGFCMSIYPFINGLISQNEQNAVIQTYESKVAETSKANRKQMQQEAEEYNSMLFQTNGAIVGNINDEVLSHEHYQQLLNASDNGVMGSLEIPKISVHLPIYHGTDDDTLSVGVGHVEGSSLPVGGKNTRTILTGHRGLPSSKLFTRLDEIVDGDLFFITTSGETMAYQVNDIQVMEPEEASLLEIEPDKDLATLITCTPYGLNTHRLVITGKRVPYEQKEKEEINESIPSLRELAFIALPVLFLIAMIIFIVMENRRRRKE